jgi:hypothetical protein
MVDLVIVEVIDGDGGDVLVVGTKVIMTLLITVMESFLGYFLCTFPKSSQSHFLPQPRDFCSNLFLVVTETSPVITGECFGMDPCRVFYASCPGVSLMHWYGMHMDSGLALVHTNSENAREFS